MMHRLSREALLTDCTSQIHAFKLTLLQVHRAPNLPKQCEILTYVLSAQRQIYCPHVHYSYDSPVVTDSEILSVAWFPGLSLHVGDQLYMLVERMKEGMGKGEDLS